MSPLAPRLQSGDPRVSWVAGEPSGDMLAALLLQGLRARWPGMQASGIGGPAMVAQGLDAWWPSEALAVRGYVEVLRHYRRIVKIREALSQRLLDGPRPDLFVGVDAPDFNLKLEARLKAAGVPTVHFVCPSVWAWRPERVHQIRQSADLVLCLFPFEPELLQRHGIEATYVGHPLAPVIPMHPQRSNARRALGLDDADTVLALLPGSRASEVAYLAPLFLATAQRLLRARPALKLLLPAVPNLRPAIEQAVAAAGLLGQVQLLHGQSHLALEACDLTLIASGTATLEAALYKRPMVIAYRMNPLSWFMMKRQKLQPWVGLPNILCGDFVVPEYLQSQATPEALAGAVEDWLAQPQRVVALERRFTELHQTLLRDTAQIASHAIEKILSR